MQTLDSSLNSSLDTIQIKEYEHHEQHPQEVYNRTANLLLARIEERSPRTTDIILDLVAGFKASHLAIKYSVHRSYIYSIKKLYNIK